MTDYRVYTLTSGNHIKSAPVIVKCDTDPEAIEQARQLMSEEDIEVWQGARCLTRIKPMHAK